MKIRRFLSCFLASGLLLGGFAGCSPSNGGETQTTGKPETEAGTETEKGTDATTDAVTDAVTEAVTDAVT